MSNETTAVVVTIVVKTGDKDIAVGEVQGMLERALDALNDDGTFLTYYNLYAK